MSVLNLYVYGYRRISPLKAKSFHLWMCILLQVCYCFEVAAVFCFYYGVTFKETQL